MKRLMTTLLFVLLCGTGLGLAQDGVTVSGTVTFNNPYSEGQVVEGAASGTVKLLQNGSEIYTGTVTSAYNSELGNGISSYAIQNVAAGTYTLSFEGEGYAKTLVYTGEITVESTDLTKDFLAEIDETRGFMTLNIRFDENVFETGYSYNSVPVTDATASCTQTGGGHATLTAASDQQGVVKFLVPKDETRRYTIHITSNAYQDTTFETAGCSQHEYAGIRFTNTNVYMREKPLPTVSLSGNVTLGGEKLNALPGEMKIGLKTVKGKHLTAEVANGQYAFEAVPVGETTLYLQDPDGSYDYNLDNTLAANYAVKTPADGKITLGQDETASLQNIDLERIAVNVSGELTGLAAGTSGFSVMLTDKNDPSKTYRTSTNTVDAFTFKGVKPGTYTVSINGTGYEPENAIPEVTVTLDQDVAVPAIAMNAVDVQLTISVNLGKYNDYKGETDYLAGAKIELWAYDRDTESKTTLLTEKTMTESDYGRFEYSTTAKLGSPFFIQVSHTGIETVSKTLVANSQYSSFDLSGDIQFIYDGPALLSVENFQAQWDEAKDSLILSWRWPDALKDADTYEIERIQLDKKRTEVPGPGIMIKYWSAPYDRETGKASFAFDSLPVTLKDMVENGYQYTYSFSIRYKKPYAGILDTNFIVDFRIKHTLAYGVNDTAMGSIRTENEAGSHYFENDNIVLIAVPNDGYKFVEWQGSRSIEENAPIDPAYTTDKDTLTFFMPYSDLRLTAVFKKNRFAITLNVNLENAGTVSGGGTYEGDTTVTIKAVANNGYQFKAWMEGDQEVTTKAEYKFKPEDDRTLTAVFEEMKYVLGVGVNNPEWGKVEGSGEFAVGSEVTVKAIANEGYKFVAWMDGETEVSKEAVYVFKMPAKDLTLTAVFEDAATYYTVTLQANKAEWGTVAGDGEFAEGHTATVRATPNENYHFVAWMEGDREVSTTAVYSFKVEKDVTLTAVFAEGSANEELEAARWSLYAENGTLVINGLSGDRYSVYDLNGRLAGQALCTGAEIRMDVAPNKLYIVRRISAAGLFGAKKIIVR